jgi:outer membrane receptor protein involved in Fe transport
MTAALVIAPTFGPLSDERINNVALFGSVETDLGPRWTAGVEMRWARDRITLTNRLNDGSGAVDGRFENSWRSFTPRFTLGYALADDMHLYANVAKGTKPGDFNPETDDEAFREVDEEAVWTYEAGFKGALNSTTDLVLAVYHSDIDNQQLTTLVELDGGRTASLLTNAGRTQVNGVEAELTLRPSDALRVSLSYAWTDAEFRDYISQEQADLLGSDGSIADNNRLGSVRGKRLPRIPKHTAAAVVSYARPVAAQLEGYGTVDWTFESSRFAQEHNLIETGDRSLINLRGGIRSDDWDISLWVRNLFDDTTPTDIQRYFDSRSGALPSFPQVGPRVSSSPRGFVIHLPPGRQAGMTVTHRF